jgi:hypothetical protein
MLQLKDIKKVTFKGKEYTDIKSSNCGNLMINYGKQDEMFFSREEPFYLTQGYNRVYFTPKNLKITL